MRKILATTLIPDLGASISRVKPLTTLSGVSVHLTNTPLWKDVSDCDILFVHRAVDEKDIGIIKLGKQAGKKIWVDIDDDYLNVPMDHSSYDYYRNTRKREIVKESIKEADVVTISNQLLLESFGEFNKNIHFVPCSYSEKYIHQFRIKWSEKKKRICWRGSQTHNQSLLEFGDAMVSVSEKHPDWEWYFLGDKPWTFCERLKTKRLVVNAEETSMELLHTYIAAIQPVIQIMPLANNHFTKSRSNMAWMDGLVGGAITIAPDWPNWDVPGVLKYGNSPKEFETKLSYCMGDFESGSSFLTTVEAGWDHMLENYTWEAVNKIQSKILETL